jgi:putative membrane protein
VPAPGDLPSPSSESAKSDVRRGHILFRAPSPIVALALILLGGLGTAALFAPPFGFRYSEEFLFVFAGPTIVTGLLSTPLAQVLGGRLEFRRSVLLALMGLGFALPIAAAWHGARYVWPSFVPSQIYLVPFVVGPVFWFRHLSVFGVSRSSHARMLPVSFVQPGLFLLGDFALTPPTAKVVGATIAFLVLAFGCALAVLRASDRPIRREFHRSGVSLIRPLLDHVADRDPEATRALEEFFLQSTVAADVRVSLLTFSRGGSVHATLALPAIHPGPFAALGSSDLPRKFAEFLGTAGGTVLVPHTPSDHDLDLPSDAEMAKVGEASQRLLAAMGGPMPSRASPLVEPYPGSFARAQVLGNVAVVLVSRAPEPTDDIAFAVADRVVREIARDGGGPVVLVDAHNSYIEGQGDISYGSPEAEKLATDAKAAVAAARAAVTDGPVEVGVAARAGYSIGTDGIGPQGMRAIAVRAGGATTGYVVIDGNNLIMGERAPIVAELSNAVNAAEVLTTDNHVVHEVDGGINPVGERYPRASMVRDARAVLDAAVADLAPVEIRYGTTDVTGVRVLGPNYTARLLTSLGDTLSMFANMGPASFLLLLTSSLVVALLLR